LISSLPGVGIGILFFLLFLFLLYIKSPPNNKEILPIKDPITVPSIVGILFGDEGEVIFIHLYSSILLTSSKKMSLSIVEL